MTDAKGLERAGDKESRGGVLRESWRDKSVS